MSIKLAYSTQNEFAKLNHPLLMCMYTLFLSSPFSSKLQTGGYMHRFELSCVKIHTVELCLFNCSISAFRQMVAMPNLANIGNWNSTANKISKGHILHRHHSFLISWIDQEAYGLFCKYFYRVGPLRFGNRPFLIMPVLHVKDVPFFKEDYLASGDDRFLPAFQ